MHTLNIFYRVFTLQMTMSVLITKLMINLPSVTLADDVGEEEVSAAS